MEQEEPKPSLREKKLSASAMGKRPKRFLEKDDALTLANSVAEIQERKSLSKAEKYSNLKVEKLKNDSIPSSTPKTKLKHAKAVLAAKRAMAKKEKARGRKERLKQDSGNTDGHSPTEEPQRTARKSVSFA